MALLRDETEQDGNVCGSYIVVGPACSTEKLTVDTYLVKSGGVGIRTTASGSRRVAGIHRLAASLGGGLSGGAGTVRHQPPTPMSKPRMPHHQSAIELEELNVRERQENLARELVDEPTGRESEGNAKARTPHLPITCVFTNVVGEPFMPLVNIYAGLLQTVFLDDSSTDAVSESWLWERLDKMEIKGGSYAEAEFNGSGNKHPGVYRIPQRDRNEKVSRLRTEHSTHQNEFAVGLGALATNYDVARLVWNE
ncbi:hypothetical protein V8E55_004420 [Tylopilus felleus]